MGEAPGVGAVEQPSIDAIENGQINYPAIPQK
jgi:hypothetical protein